MKALEVSFTPVNNQRLANLCGVLDENLRQIETALEVVITHRGECFALTGEPNQTRLAAQALERFYAQAKQRLSVEDVQLGLIEVTRTKPWSKPGMCRCSKPGVMICTAARRARCSI